VDAHNSELDHATVGPQPEQDLARVGIPIMDTLEDLDIDEAAVMPFNGDGHVMFVDEQLIVGRRHFVGGDEFIFGQIAGGREERE
jgi:hypothetical protein